MPLIFSYGSLQQDAVQLANYGRVLHGERDELIGWVRTKVDVPEWHKAAAAGLSHYANVERTPESGDAVTGTVFELTDAELAATDAYELDAEYARVVVALASGRSAWVYVSRPR
ncbi:MAG TPA: gamma-glutamylcyclotransferase family protein [Steroidobacteraceae bacterium]|nr:gamma-glutamylcyclotransferase family protein [Steroidobacteraceae bacterium]